MNVKCPCCSSPIVFRKRLKLITRGHICCPSCNSKLATSILSSVLVSIAVGAPAYATTKWLLVNAEINTAATIILPVLVILLVSQLMSPLKQLVAVE